MWFFVNGRQYTSQMSGVTGTMHNVSGDYVQKMTLQWNKLGAFKPLSPELNPICYLLALLAHDILHDSRVRVKSLTLRLLMSHIYIYGAPIPDVSRSHTTTQHSR
jgi:hypothetical protein